MTATHFIFEITRSVWTWTFIHELVDFLFRLPKTEYLFQRNETCCKNLYATYNRRWTCRTIVQEILGEYCRRHVSLLVDNRHKHLRLLSKPKKMPTPRRLLNIIIRSSLIFIVILIKSAYVFIMKIKFIIANKIDVHTW